MNLICKQAWMVGRPCKKDPDADHQNTCPIAGDHTGNPPVQGISFNSSPELVQPVLTSTSLPSL